MPKQRSECSVVNTMTMEASRLIRDIAPPAEGHNVKSRIAKAARRLAWTFNRAKDVWFADGRISVRAHEMDQLRRLKAEADTKARRHADLNEAARLEALAARLLRDNPEEGGRLADPYLRAARAYRAGFEEVK